MSYTLRGRLETRLAAALAAVRSSRACLALAPARRGGRSSSPALMVGVGLALDASLYHRLLPYQPGWAALPLGLLELGADDGARPRCSSSARRSGRRSGSSPAPGSSRRCSRHAGLPLLRLDLRRGRRRARPRRRRARPRPRRSRSSPSLGVAWAVAAADRHARRRRPPGAARPRPRADARRRAGRGRPRRDRRSRADDVDRPRRDGLRRRVRDRGRRRRERRARRRPSSRARRWTASTSAAARVDDPRLRDRLARRRRTRRGSTSRSRFDLRAEPRRAAARSRGGQRGDRHRTSPASTDPRQPRHRHGAARRSPMTEMSMGDDRGQRGRRTRSASGSSAATTRECEIERQQRLRHARRPRVGRPDARRPSRSSPTTAPRPSSTTTSSTAGPAARCIRGRDDRARVTLEELRRRSVEVIRAGQSPERRLRRVARRSRRTATRGCATGRSSPTR